MMWEKEFKQVKKLEKKGSKHAVRCLSHDGISNKSYKLLADGKYVEFNDDGSVFGYGEIRTHKEVVCHKDYTGKDLPLLDQILIKEIIEQAFKLAKHENK